MRSETAATSARAAVLASREMINQRLAHHAPTAAPFDTIGDDAELYRNIETYRLAWEARCIQSELRDLLREGDSKVRG